MPHPTRPSPAPATTRKMAQGTIVGLTADNGAHVWRGIPYGASTAGENRWRAPQPGPQWEGTRECLTFADRCAQLTNEFDAKDGLKPGLVIGSEDCLALDLYAPPHADGGLPVMVWIHGGGNVWGRSSAYDGSQLAVNENVVVVMPQYRVGPLGWFAHVALRSTASSEDDLTACFATLDLIAALRWTADNIAAFGGDPSCVTIFGESSGGHNVVTLLAASQARGLFHRAVVQSGSFDSTPLAVAEGSEGDHVNAARRIADKLGARSAEELRALSVDTLLGAYTLKPGFVDVPRVIEDGVTLPVDPLREAFTSTTTFAPVPVILGSNRDEMKLFYLRDPRLTRKVMGVFVQAHDQAFYDHFTRYVSRLWRIRSVDEPATAMIVAGHDAVYAYRFDWDGGGRFLFMDFGEMLGAAHGFEIPFVLNRFQHLGDADRFLFTRRSAAERERLSRAMGAYWASFARDGVPSHEQGPDWPAYGARGRGLALRFDVESDGGISVMAAPDSVDALVADLNVQSGLDQAQRCMIVEDMGKWMFGERIHDFLISATGCG